MEYTSNLVYQPIQYSLSINNRIRSIRLVVRRDGQVVVTAPRWVTRTMIERFISSKSVWIVRTIARFKKSPILSLAGDSSRGFIEYKQSALRLTQERIAHFNTFYNFTFSRISIKNQRTRWGSCSKKGNLNFNYRIALLPKELADYIVVHELCHLGEFNHSPRFWSLVARTIPDHRVCKNQLKHYSFNCC